MSMHKVKVENILFCVYEEIFVNYWLKLLYLKEIVEWLREIPYISMGKMHNSYH